MTSTEEEIVYHLPEDFKVDPEELTMGDLEEFEDYFAGKSFFSVQKAAGDDGLPMKAINVIVWLQLRHRDHELSLDDVRKVPMTEMMKIGKNLGATDPKEV